MGKGLDPVTLTLAKSNTKKSLEGKGSIQGQAGKSAYEIWLEAGNTGNQQAFLNSLKGKSPVIDVTKSGLKTSILVDAVLKAAIFDGKDGSDGKSAYELAVLAGYAGTESDWLEALHGRDGIGIADISKTSTAGNVDTYTITKSDGTSTTFTVRNASEGTITKLSQLENDEAFIKATADNLANYYKKTETYTKEETEEIVGRVTSGLTTAIVPQLPTENISATKIYLIRVGSTNNYTQYMWIDNDWANLGSTAINLENFYTKDDIDGILENYPTLSEMATAIANALSDYTKTEDLADVALSGDYNDLKNLPAIPDVTALETKAHATETFATKTEVANISQIDDGAASASKTWSSQKTSGEIAKAKIVDVADRAAYKQLRQNPQVYDSEKFYVFPENDSLCIMHGDKELTGKSNTLQLGTPQSVSLPFTATSDGVLSVYVANSASGSSGSCTLYLKRNNAEGISVQGFGDAFAYKDIIVKKGDVITVRQEISVASKTAKFFPFVPTTGEPVDQTFDPTSSKPQSGTAVAEALRGLIKTATKEYVVSDWVASQGGGYYASPKPYPNGVTYANLISVERETYSNGYADTYPYVNNAGVSFTSSANKSCNITLRFRYI